MAAEWSGLLRPYRGLDRPTFPSMKLFPPLIPLSLEAFSSGEIFHFVP